MPPTFRSAYAGGYSDEIKNRQLEAFRHAILLHGANVALAKNNTKCRICTGNQTVELKCCICDKIKSLDEFAKAQRQDRDAARCLNCVQSHADAEPVLEEPKLLTESELSTAPDTYTTGQLESRSLIASTQRLTLKVAPTARHVNSSGEQEDTDNASIIGGVSLIEHHNEKENPARRGPSFTAFGPDGVARRRSGSPSGAPPVHGGWASFGVNVNATATKPLPKKGGSLKFAKVPGKRFEKHEAPTMRIPEPIGATVPSDDEAGEEAGAEDYL
ncbi:hypothetical protein CDV55_102948 [Aspergillus turcosus]|nr:hypothetical protein CDV55_102948 [Aspergillus turcosus]